MCAPFFAITKSSPPKFTLLCSVPTKVNTALICPGDREPLLRHPVLDGVFSRRAGCAAKA